MLTRFSRAWHQRDALLALWRAHLHATMPLVPTTEGGATPGSQDATPQALSPNFESFQKARPDDAIKAMFAKGVEETSRGEALLPFRVYAQALIEELGIKTLDIEVADAIDDFTREVVMSAGWYQYRYLRAFSEARKFVWINVAMVAGMPLAIILFAWLAERLTVSSTASQIAAVVTGIFALQKTLSAWYAQRQQYASWYNTSYSLKCLYTTFKQKWAAHAEPPSDEMLADMHKAIEAARDLVKTERMAFYQALTPPTFDALSMITSQQTTVTTWLTALIPAKRTAATPDASKKQDASVPDTGQPVPTTDVTGASTSDSLAAPAQTPSDAEQGPENGSSDETTQETAVPQDEARMMPVAVKLAAAVPDTLTDQVVELCFDSGQLKNAADIDQLFSGNFIDWFNRTMKASTPFIDRGHNHIHDDAITRSRFEAFWNRIPGIFGADFITAPQFIALMCINIQECGGNFWANPELVGNAGHPGLAYAFDYIKNLKASYNTFDNNISAYKLFQDPDYVAAHKSLGGYTQVVSGGVDRTWEGIIWPSQFDKTVDLQKNGFIMQADFYKLRGRGVIQTTGRSNYKALLGYLSVHGLAQTTAVMHRVAKLRPTGVSNWTPTDKDLDKVLKQCTTAELDVLLNDADVLAAGVFTYSQKRGFFSLKNEAKTLGSTSSIAGSYYRVGASINASTDYQTRARSKMVAMTMALARSLDPNVGVARPPQHTLAA